MQPVLVVDNGPIRKAITVTYQTPTVDRMFQGGIGALWAGYLMMIAGMQIMLGAHAAMVEHALGGK